MDEKERLLRIKKIDDFIQEQIGAEPGTGNSLIYVSGDMLTIALPQRLLDENSVTALGEAVNEVLNVDAPKVLIDMSGVQFISSAGIGKILILQKKAALKNTKIAVGGVSKSILEVFKILRLDKFVDVFASLEDAREHLMSLG